MTTAFAENVLLFGRVLRRAGLDVHYGRLIDAVRALQWIDVGRRADVAGTLRSLLVHDRDDIARFDAVFDRFFRAHRQPEPGPPLFSLGERPRVVVRAASGAELRVDMDDVQPGSSPSSRAVGAWSPSAVLRRKDFGEFTDAELARARAVLERLPWTLSVRRTRRWARASTGAADLRPMLRRNLLRGDLIDMPRRERREAARPIVVLGDVSGSMERYSRMLLYFVYGLTHGGRRVESFLFATRLTRVTGQLTALGGRAALSHVARSVQDWGGGTRIGEALRSFNTRWARRVMRNGPIVLIVSDGWDRGDPALIAREIARLRRSCRRLIWLNPLLGSERYEPLTRGMQAALRHVDDFLPSHNLASLEQLAEHLRTLGRTGAARQGLRPSREAH
jgi:uncharacterized protein with von Willebrand factor type A (vWA) domain